MHYSDDNSFLFVNDQKVSPFKGNGSIISGANTEILTKGTLTRSYPSDANNRLSSKDINDTKTYGNVYDFSLDYSNISNEEILQIHKYLMKKNDVV